MNAKWGFLKRKAALSTREFESLLSRAAELTKSGPLQVVKGAQSSPKPKRPAA